MKTSGYSMSTSRHGKEVMSYSVIWCNHVISGLPSMIRCPWLRSLHLSFRIIARKCCIHFERLRKHKSKKSEVRVSVKSNQKGKSLLVIHIEKCIKSHLEKFIWTRYDQKTVYFDFFLLGNHLWKGRLLFEMQYLNYEMRKQKRKRWRRHANWPLPHP